MARTIPCVAIALLTAGVAQSSPPPETISSPHPPRIRFLSLAEARAIALENGGIAGTRWLSPNVALDNPPQGSDAVRVLARPGKKGIRITGILHDSRRDEYERNINQTLLNVETAYWNLYGSYWQLHSREQALRFAYEAWKIVGAKYKVGRVRLADFAQTEGQYNLFRSQRLQALDTMLDNERQLRAILGMPVGEGVRLVPSDAPTLKEKNPDWQEALTKALKKRPELRMTRKEVKRAEAKVREMETTEHPGLIRRAAWEDRPTCLHDAELQLKRSRLVLQDQELKTERFLGLEYRRMSSAYLQIEAARKQRQAFATQLRLRSEYYRSDKKEGTLDLLLEAQRFWADALATEYQAIVTYNNALCGWEYAKGSIMAHTHVRLGEEPSPDHKAVRAVVRERKRTRQQVRRTSGVSANSPLTAPDDHLLATAPSLPALWRSFPPLWDAEELRPWDLDPNYDSFGFLKQQQDNWTWSVQARPRLRRLATMPQDPPPLTEWRVSDIFPPCIPPAQE